MIDVEKGEQCILRATDANPGPNHTIMEYKWMVNGTRDPDTGPTLSLNTDVVGTFDIVCDIKNDCGAWSTMSAMETVNVIYTCPIPTLTGIVRS